MDELEKLQKMIDKLDRNKGKMTGQQYMDIMVAIKGLHAKWNRDHPGELMPEDGWGIKEFKKGHWYVCKLRVAPSEWAKQQANLLDGKPHLCTDVTPGFNKKYPNERAGGFKEAGGCDLWMKEDMQYFKEVPAPPK